MSNEIPPETFMEYEALNSRVEAFSQRGQFRQLLAAEQARLRDAPGTGG